TLKSNEDDGSAGDRWVAVNSPHKSDMGRGLQGLIAAAQVGEQQPSQMLEATQPTTTTTLQAPFPNTSYHNFGQTDTQHSSPRKNSSKVTQFGESNDAQAFS